MFQFDFTSIGDEELVELIAHLAILVQQTGNCLLCYLAYICSMESLRRDNKAPAELAVWDIKLPIERASDPEIKQALSFFLTALGHCRPGTGFHKLMDGCYLQCEFASFHEDGPLN